MKLTGLDFETANFRSGSICSVGCAVVEDGAVTQTMGCLVRPHKSMNYVNDVCYDTHGINWFCLQKATEFPQVWEELRPLLTVSDCVVIHNAPFDLRHLRAVLELYQLPVQKFSYVCSLAVSRERFPELKSHTLDSIASRFKLSFQHYNALEDAVACAQILFQMKFSENDVQLFS